MSRRPGGRRRTDCLRRFSKDKIAAPAYRFVRCDRVHAATPGGNYRLASCGRGSSLDRLRCRVDSRSCRAVLGHARAGVSRHGYRRAGVGTGALPGTACVPRCQSAHLRVAERPACREHACDPCASSCHRCLSRSFGQRVRPVVARRLGGRPFPVRGRARAQALASRHRSVARRDPDADRFPAAAVRGDRRDVPVAESTSSLFAARARRHRRVRRELRRRAPARGPVRCREHLGFVSARAPGGRHTRSAARVRADDLLVSSCLVFAERPRLLGSVVSQHPQHLALDRGDGPRNGAALGDVRDCRLARPLDPHDDGVRRRRARTRLSRSIGGPARVRAGSGRWGARRRLAVETVRRVALRRDRRSAGARAGAARVPAFGAARGLARIRVGESPVGRYRDGATPGRRRPGEPRRGGRPDRGRSRTRQRTRAATGGTRFC